MNQRLVFDSGLCSSRSSGQSRKRADPLGDVVLVPAEDFVAPVARKDHGDFFARRPRNQKRGKIGKIAQRLVEEARKLEDEVGGYRRERVRT